MTHSLLKQLKTMTTVVADTGDIDSIKHYAPQDATTNPSLIFQASQMPQHRHLVEDAIKKGKNSPGDWVENTLDHLAVNFGKALLELIPGRVSTEVDAYLSFSQEKMLLKARKLVSLYEEEGIGRERILIKLASTWEGIETARELEKEGIKCNLTLLFNFAQAVCCADANVFLISPFVGRILDWHKNNGAIIHHADEDPGVKFVTHVFNYFKTHDHKTIVMGASFRNIDEITQLSGCDYLTISPTLLGELDSLQHPLEQKLTSKAAFASEQPKVSFDEGAFRWAMNKDPMATEKLSEGIRNFHQDYLKLKEFIASF